MIWEHDHRFQCEECKCEATLRRTEDGRLKELVCRTTNCLYEDTPYDQNAILHVMLDAEYPWRPPTGKSAGYWKNGRRPSRCVPTSFRLIP